MIVKYIYLLNLKYKQLLCQPGYHAYYYIISKKFGTIHLFLQSLRLQGLKFLYVKHTRYLGASQFLKYFIAGPYIIVNFNTVDLNLISNFSGIQLIALSLNNAFINPQYFKNWISLQTWSNFGVMNFVPLMSNIDFWKNRLQLTCYVLCWRVYHYVKWLQRRFTMLNDD